MFNLSRVVLYFVILVGMFLHCPSDAQTSSDQTAAPPGQQTEDSRKPLLPEKNPGVATPPATPTSQPASNPSKYSPNPAAKPVPMSSSSLAEEGAQGVPLLVGGEEILRFKGTISGFTPEQRVQAILLRLKKLEPSSSFNIESITTKETGFSTDVVVGNDTIFTITDRDAALVGHDSRETLAGACVEKLKKGLLKESDERSPRTLFMASVFTGVALLTLVLALTILSAVFPRVYRQITQARGKYISSLKIQKAELLSEDSLTDILIGVCRIVRALVTLLLLIVFVEVTLGFFPTTRAISGQVTERFVYPILGLVLTSITSYVPNLLIIVAVGVGTYYLIAFTHFIFNEVGRGSITFAGFEQEWADPTYKIIRFMIIAFALVLMFPYLPGSGSPAFQQVSIFLGVLISLGSSGAVSNVVAGVFLTYTGAFRLGDRVRIADTVGDVTERRLLYTRIRTIKDEFITIPNSLVLGSHIINYSASMQGNGLVLHTSVTIGYGVEWRTVEKLLIEAAKATENVRTEPAPFVFVTSLDDFFVSHQINAYTSTPHSMAQIYADLHKNILDKFNEAGVEIMSPHYTSLRDGNEDALPSKYRGESQPRKPFPLH